MSGRGKAAGQTPSSLLGWTPPSLPPFGGGVVFHSLLIHPNFFFGFEHASSPGVKITARRPQTPSQWNIPHQEPSFKLGKMLNPLLIRVLYPQTP